jgi:hypothetical protein
MLYAAIDIHKRTFQAAVLDPDSGELSEQRFAGTREELDHWATPGRVGSSRSRSWRRPAGAGSHATLSGASSTFA